MLPPPYRVRFATVGLALMAGLAVPLAASAATEEEAVALLAHGFENGLVIPDQAGRIVVRETSQSPAVYDATLNGNQPGYMTLTVTKTGPCRYESTFRFGAPGQQSGLVYALDLTRLAKVVYSNRNDNAGPDGEHIGLVTFQGGKLACVNVSDRDRKRGCGSAYDAATLNFGYAPRIAAMARVYQATFCPGNESGVTPASSKPADTLPWGNKEGMQVSVIAKAGIGTSHAAIRLKRLRPDRDAYCRALAPHGDIPACMAHLTAEDLSGTITADCRAGTFTNLNGEHLTAHRQNGNLTFTDDAGEEVSFPSGSFVDEMQFRALCPP